MVYLTLSGGLLDHLELDTANQVAGQRTHCNQSGISGRHRDRQEQKRHKGTASNIQEQVGKLGGKMFVCGPAGAVLGLLLAGLGLSPCRSGLTTAAWGGVMKVN